MFLYLQKIYFAISNCINAFSKKKSEKTLTLKCRETPRFVHISLAGQGGFGNVYKTNDTLLDRVVAQKEIFTTEEHFKQRAQQEAKILAKLSHPNIPAIYDIIFSENSISIIFEWIDGVTLKQFIKDNNRISFESVLPFFSDLCSALDFVHSKNIFHRDIKPSNIIIRNDNNSCVLVDFGIATDKKSSNSITQIGEVIGTPDYMAPEQRNGGVINQTTDIYALAIVLYECLSGKKFSISNYSSLAQNNPEIPETVDELIRLCTNEAQGKRVQTAKDFYMRLENAFSSKTLENDSQIWIKGSLKQIYFLLEKMNIDDFCGVGYGYKVMLFNRITKLITDDTPQMRNPLARLLSVLLPLCYKQDCSFFMKESIKYAFITQYGPNWIGNPALRKIILNIIPLTSIQNIESIAEEIPMIVSEITSSSMEENVKKGFYIDMENIIIALLNRTHEPIIDSMTTQLDHILRLIQK